MARFTLLGFLFLVTGCVTSELQPPKNIPVQNLSTDELRYLAFREGYDSRVNRERDEQLYYEQVLDELGERSTTPLKLLSSEYRAAQIKQDIDAYFVNDGVPIYLDDFAARFPIQVSISTHNHECGEIVNKDFVIKAFTYKFDWKFKNSQIFKDGEYSYGISIGFQYNVDKISKKIYAGPAVEYVEYRKFPEGIYFDRKILLNCELYLADLVLNYDKRKEITSTGNYAEDFLEQLRHDWGMETNQ